MFITLEGIDGSGKSTQVEHIKRYLEAQGSEVVTLCDPGSTELGAALREIVLHSDAEISSIAGLLLFAAARAQLVHEQIAPNMLQKTVVCDRFADSTVAYQGYGEGLLGVVNHLARLGPLTPDLTFWLDIDPELAAKRTQGADKFESEGLDFMRRVREGYKEQARRHPDRIIRIDASQDIESVSKQITSHL